MSAARRMKGVVRPQARPTRRKPRVQLRIEGEEVGAVSVSVSDIVEVDGRNGGQWEEIELCQKVGRMTKRNLQPFSQ